MKEKLTALLKENMPHIDFESSTALVDDGILDSLSLITIISLLGTELGIVVPYEEIVEENFNSVDAMVSMIERLQD